MARPRKANPVGFDVHRLIKHPEFAGIPGVFMHQWLPTRSVFLHGYMPSMGMFMGLDTTRRKTIPPVGARRP